MEEATKMNGATVDGQWVNVSDLPPEMVDLIAGAFTEQLLGIYIGGFKADSEEAKDVAAETFSKLMHSLDEVIMGAVVIELCANVLALTEAISELNSGNLSLPLKLEDL